MKLMMMFLDTRFKFWSRNSKLEARRSVKIDERAEGWNWV